MLAKLEDGILRYAHREPIVIDGQRYFNPSDDLLRRAGYLDVPEVGNDRPVIAWNVVDGMLTPTYGEPYQSTETTAKERRRDAYRTEADRYLIAYYGYLIEGDAAKASEAKAVYLEKKQEIRERYPDVDTTV